MTTKLGTEWVNASVGEFYDKVCYGLITIMYQTVYYHSDKANNIWWKTEYTRIWGKASIKLKKFGKLKNKTWLSDFYFYYGYLADFSGK